MIQKKNISELSPQLLQLFERARTAMHGRNYHYAADIFSRIVHDEPGCLDARRLLRATQVDSIGGRKKFLPRLATVLSMAIPLRVKGPRLLREGKIEAALDLAESLLRLDPTSRPALHFLARAAAAAGLDETATATLEFCLQHHPDDEATLRLLITHCRHIGQGERAVAAITQLLRLHPNDLQLQTELKQATAEFAIKENKWDEAESYREMIRDPDKAQRLEQEERIAAPKEEEALQKMTAAARADVDQEPTSVPRRKHLAETLIKAREFDEAIEQYEKILELLDRDDPTIRDAITAATAARYDDAVSRWENYAQKDPEHHREEAEKQIADILRKKRSFLRETYEERARKYPNEARYHFELGQLCFEMGDADAALREFQQARQNRNLQARALVYIGRCMEQKGMHDLAAEQLEQALECGEQRMSRERLGILYDLALLYERLKRQEDYQRLLKEIYAVDVSFKDVAERIEQCYRANNAER